GPAAAGGETILGRDIALRCPRTPQRGVPTIIMKIDIHTHILPREWPDLDKNFGYSGFVRLEHCDDCSARMMIGNRLFREITDNAWNPARRIEEMDRSGVSMQALSTVPVMFSYWAKPKDAL